MEKKDASDSGNLTPVLSTGHDLLLETAGRCMAYEFALKAIIATHPDAKALAALWRQRSAELIEAAMESPVYYQNASYSTGMNAALGRLAVFLQDGTQENR